MPASLFYLAPLAPEAGLETGLAGMRSGLYQRMLREISAHEARAGTGWYSSMPTIACGPMP